MTTLTPGLKIEYTDMYTGRTLIGVISEVLSMQVVLEDGVFVLNRNIKNIGELNNE